MMKLDEKLVQALNEQVNAEFYASYLYFSMAIYFQSQNLKGFASWMHTQAHEEWGHGMKIITYLLDQGCEVSLKEIAKPQIKWESPLAVFEDSLKHEQKVTGMINDLYNMANSQNDHATGIFLQWFITEQVEEEASATEVIEKLKIADGKPNLIFMLDRELGQRKKE